MEVCRLGAYTFVPFLYMLLRKHFYVCLRMLKNLTKFAVHTLQVTERKSLLSISNRIKE